MGGMWVPPASGGNGEALAPTRWGQEAGPWGGDQVRGGHEGGSPVLGPVPWEDEEGTPELSPPPGELPPGLSLLASRLQNSGRRTSVA